MRSADEKGAVVTGYGGDMFLTRCYAAQGTEGGLRGGEGGGLLPASAPPGKAAEQKAGRAESSNRVWTCQDTAKQRGGGCAWLFMRRRCCVVQAGGSEGGGSAKATPPLAHSTYMYIHIELLPHRGSNSICGLCVYSTVYCAPRIRCSSVPSSVPISRSECRVPQGGDAVERRTDNITNFL